MRILYVDIDTIRPDHLGCYGYTRNTSPNIDKVAQEAVRFNDYYCSDAPCLPSRAALATGRFGIHTGCVGHGGINAEMRPEGKERGMADFNGRYNLPAVMRRAGMKTASISSFADRHAAWWFNGGFDETYNIGKRGLELGDEVIDLALDWLQRKESIKDWFLHVHVWDPHIPYRTPEEFGKPFENSPLPDPWMNEELLAQHRNSKPGAHSACEVNGYTPAEDIAHPRQITEIKDLSDFKTMIDEYDTGVLFADYNLGKMFDLLREQKIYDETIIIISGDHGECLGEKGAYCEHGEADYITTHIPLIIKWPGCPQNVESNGLHYNVDLLPTLIDMIGNIPPFKCNRVVGKPNPAVYDGESFAPCIKEGKNGGREFLVVSQCAHVCQRAVRFDNWIYIRTYHDGYHLSEADELFDVEKDPHEITNVASLYKDVCWHGAWYLEHWVADNMLSNIYNYHEDPLWSVIAEGGPFHCRGYLQNYCTHLEETGRGNLAKELSEKHPEEFRVSY
ncbi:sulfatase [uncultured Sphaerochaeta sp.]|uniref:sulfatase family protein n=1 Tax=uncultured Sphaerochaeta sp. TaxID=886478 RepID=UPI002A0A4196|nr:sulfatase [uncultured Sphaerochaeta sp.]